jgi:hypothetical protein
MFAAQPPHPRPCPTVPSSLAAPPDCPEPIPDNLVHKTTDAFAVSRLGVIFQPGSPTPPCPPSPCRGGEGDVVPQARDRHTGFLSSELNGGLFFARLFHSPFQAGLSRRFHRPRLPPAKCSGRWQIFRRNRPKEHSNEYECSRANPYERCFGPRLRSCGRA